MYGDALHLSMLEKPSLWAGYAWIKKTVNTQSADILDLFGDQAETMLYIATYYVVYKTMDFAYANILVKVIIDTLD